jgi:hypothetical protein
MNYYEEKKESQWHLEQLKEFKKSESFLTSAAFMADGKAALLFLRKDGLVLSNDGTERFENAIEPFEDWKKENYSPEEELKYNTWVEVQKEAFKQTEEYKRTDLACFIEAKVCTKNIPADDGLEIFEDGTVELCTGEKFENVVTPLNEFVMNNDYEKKKHRDWRNEQIKSFKESATFKNSEAFKIEGKSAIILIKDDGSLFADISKENFSDPVVVSWDDWKKDNYSETEELAYNQMLTERRLNSPDQIFLKPEKEVDHSATEEMIDTSVDTHNYYEQIKLKKWEEQQVWEFFDSQSFRKSKAFAVNGENAISDLIVEKNGTVKFDVGIISNHDYEVEVFSDAVMAWDDWKKENYSETEELEYNKLVEERKKLRPLDNLYEEKKLTEWKVEQSELFHHSQNFLSSECFKNECRDDLINIKDSNIEIFVDTDGGIILNPDYDGEVFPDAVMAWDDWKKNNYSETEELAYNKMIEERFLKPEKEVDQSNAEEHCMAMG